MTTRFQQRLTEHCIRNNLGLPIWQDISDHRGIRTAWSCYVVVQGRKYYASYWYDGAHAHQAREDAAEAVLMALGVIPPHPHSGRPYGVIP